MDPTDIILSDRDNHLYEIFKQRLMHELKIVGYRLVPRLCEHGRSLKDYCEPCGRINSGG